VAKVKGNLRVQIEEERAIIRHGKLPRLLIDEIHMTAVLQNLISNAIKFHGPERPIVDISCAEEPDRWVFCVRDNGIGIEASNLNKAFQIFQRLHTYREYPGTGIGLAICKKIVEGRGGSIWVESEPGQGSAFFFTVIKQDREEASGLAADA